MRTAQTLRAHARRRSARSRVRVPQADALSQVGTARIPPFPIGDDTLSLRFVARNALIARSSSKFQT